MGYPTDDEIAEAHGWNKDRPSYSELLQAGKRKRKMTKKKYVVRIPTAPPTAMPEELAKLMQESFDIAKDHGWWNRPYPNFQVLMFNTKLLLIISELIEAMEEARAGHPFDEVQFDAGKPEGVPVEMADALIRMFDLCEKYKIPLGPAYTVKTNFNKKRPMRHGGKLF